MVTTYWLERHELSASDLRPLHVPARLPAEWIKRSRVEEVLRVNQQHLASIYDTIRDVVFQVAVEPEEQFRFVSVNAAFLRVTGLSQEMVVGKTVNEVIPEPSLAMVLAKYRQAIEEKTAVLWEETSDYPTGRLTGEVSIVPVFDEKGTCTHLVGSVHDITERKRTEQVISEGEQRLRIAKDAAKLGIYEYDVATGNILWDARVRQLWGIGPDVPITIDTFFSGLHPEDRARTQAVLGRALDPAGNGEYYAEYRVTSRTDGSERWVAATGQVFFENGRAVRMIGTGQDITERKRAEAELRESEERFRNMADTAPVMIWVSDPNKRFTFVNKRWLEFTGRTMEQELGNGWAAGLHPNDLPRCYEAFSSAFDGRRNFQLECRLRRADGEYRSFLCSGVPRFAPGGIFAGYIGSDIDVTDLQSEERFRQLAENIDQVFWMFDLGAEQVVYISPAFEKVWGFSSAALYQNRGWLLESVHTEDRDRFSAFLTRLRSEPAEESYRIVRPDGSVRWIHDRSFLICDPEGKPFRVAGIAEDITVQRELQEQLQQAHKMEAVGRLAGGIAHDFNNLLTVICGYSQMLLSASGLADPSRERLEQVLNAANSASILTHQLLAFSRRQVLQPKLVNLNHVLTNMEAMLRPLMGEHITIETKFVPEVSHIKVDPHQIEQLVMNLAANARDAMPNGGQFKIETSMASASDVPAENSPSMAGNWVRLRIVDTGCGMDTRTRERAFEPFFTTKGIGKGTGLGLSTVYGIVRQNQGEIHLSSEPRQGTEFNFYFPAVAGNEADSELPAKGTPKEQAIETILVAEDELPIRELVRQTLEQLGYTVLEATDGYEAMRIIEKHAGEIHLLLTDVIMPLMNGRELAMRLQTVRPVTKVLYMSGYTDDVLAFHGIAQPEIAFIQKPFTPSELAAKVTMALTANI